MSKLSRGTKIAISAFVFIAASVAFYLLYMFANAEYGIMLDMYLDTSLVAMFISSAAAILVAVAFFVFVLKEPIRPFVFYGCICLYGVVSLFILFFKSIGVSEINLNFLESNLLSLGSLLNIMLLIPFGYLLMLFLKGLGKALLAGLVASISIEATQYLFCFGIADAGDILAYMIGIGIGIAIFMVMRKHGLKLEIAESCVQIRSIV